MKEEGSSSFLSNTPVELSDEHRQWLMERHGTVELDPLPDPTDADPHNWPLWKKLCNVTLISFHAMMGPFCAASIAVAYESIAMETHTSITRASYLTTLQIAILGGTPLFWAPLADRFGRRPILLLSLLFSMATNVGAAYNTGYASLAACNALTALFISPPIGIGSGVVTEMFFKKDRAKALGIWTLLVSIGIPISNVIFGFVVERTSYRWIYKTLAITLGVEFILYCFFGPETRYFKGSGATLNKAEIRRREYLSVRRINPQPLSIFNVLHPLKLLARPTILVAAAAYAMNFSFANVLTTVELPQLLQFKFNLSAQAVGLQFLGLVVGSLLGEQLGGFMSDAWMNLYARRHGGRRPMPEFRLWLSYIGFVLTIVGIIIFLVEAEISPAGKWTIKPVIGIAFCGFGNQVVTTVLVTYAVDRNQDESPSVGVCINFVRQMWGFIGPFWYPHMFETVGVAKSAAVVSGLLIAVSIMPTVIVQFVNASRHSKRESVAPSPAP